MTIKISEAVLAHKALTDLKSTSMEGQLSYKIKKLKDVLAPIVKNFEETKNELIKETYGELVDETSYRVSAENMPKFLEEINALLDASEELTFVKLKASSFDKIEVAPEFFDLMEAFIED